MYKRNLRLPEKPKQSFFLWGTRQTGKTTLLKACYPDALRIDLLKTDELMRYAKEPSLLREEVATRFCIVRLQCEKSQTGACKFIGRQCDSLGIEVDFILGDTLQETSPAPCEF